MSALCSVRFTWLLTHFSANVISHVLLKKTNNTRVSFFFIEKDNADSVLAEIIIRSLIWQSIDCDAISEPIEEELRKRDSALFVPLKDWTSLLGDVAKQYQSFFIFLDGLDECSPVERQALLGSLATLTASTSNLKIFIAGRESVSVDLRRRFSAYERISMTCDALAPDIHTYVTATLEERMHNGEFLCSDPLLLAEVKDILTNHADGM